MANTTHILMSQSGAPFGRGGLLCIDVRSEGFFPHGSSGPREVRLI